MPNTSKVVPHLHDITSFKGNIFTATNLFNNNLVGFEHYSLSCKKSPFCQQHCLQLRYAQNALYLKAVWGGGLSHRALKVIPHHPCLWKYSSFTVRIRKTAHTLWDNSVQDSTEIVKSFGLDTHTQISQPWDLSGSLSLLVSLPVWQGASGLQLKVEIGPYENGLPNSRHFS